MKKHLYMIFTRAPGGSARRACSAASASSARSARAAASSACASRAAAPASASAEYWRDFSTLFWKT